MRRYLAYELDVASAPDPRPPSHPLVTYAERPDLARRLYEVALESCPDQPGREGSSIGDFDDWRSWGLDPHRPDAYFVALGGDRVLEVDRGVATHGFMAVAREARGTGVASSIKRAQIAWAKASGIRTLRTVNEARLVGMQHLNERYGYVRRPAEIVLRGPAAPVP